MSDASQSGDPNAMAEEILRAIFGDDLTGCTVTLDSIAAIIRNGTSQAAPNELINLYEKVVEAVHVLSAPPPANSVTNPQELQALLTKRLDSIHAITTKTLDTVKFFKSQLGEEK